MFIGERFDLDLAPFKKFYFLFSNPLIFCFSLLYAKFFHQSHIFVYRVDFSVFHIPIGKFESPI